MQEAFSSQSTLVELGVLSVAHGCVGMKGALGIVHYLVDAVAGIGWCSFHGFNIVVTFL